MSQGVKNLASPSPLGYHEALLRAAQAARLGLWILVSTLAACGGKDPFNPGAQLGTFHVTARLGRSTCGQAPNPWDFDVRLNHDGLTLYWLQGGLPVSGQVDSSARTELRANTTTDLRPADAKQKLAACSVTRTDMLDVVLSGADAKPATDPSRTASFTGALGYRFAPTDGSDCSDQLSAVGGGFDALPCDVSYDVSGTLTSPPH
jgi:hypothetical protein